jgi:hypothetical protein
MKAERRHELKSNTLATKLVTLPDTSKKFAGRILLVCAVVAVIAFLIANRITASNASKLQQGQDLAMGRQLIDQLKQPPNPYFPGLSPSAVQRTSEDALAAIQGVIDSASDPKLLAEAWVAKGDLDWTLANDYWHRDGTPMLPGAATQPAMRPKQDRDTLLKDAAAAYQEVMDRYQNQPLARTSAQFGLAAIAEDRGAVSHNTNDWLAAEELYKAIQNSADTPASMKDQAKVRLDLLAEVQKPVILGTPEKPIVIPPTATTPAASAPAATAPAATTLIEVKPATAQPATTQASNLELKEVPLVAPITRDATHPSAATTTSKP